MSRLASSFFVAAFAAGVLVTSDASAQWGPPPQQPPPPQGQWQQPPPPQGQWQQPPPPQGQWQQPQGQWGPAPPQGQWQQPQGQWGPAPQQGQWQQPMAPAPDNRRSRGEMTFLYLTSGLYGVGSGIWLDALFKIKDPGLAAILPISLGAAAPIGVYLWDEFGGPLHRGVPSSMATGLALGAVEGIAISGVQWQYTRDDDKDWSFATQTTVTWIMATGGGIGGWAFGEWLRPDPRSMGFIASASGWGAISGTLLGAGVSGRDWKDGSSVVGLVGYNVGVLGGGAISILHTPSWESQKYMWLGYGLGTLAGFLVYPFYLFVDDPQVKRGLIANALGGIAGAGIAGALTWDLTDAEDAPQAPGAPPRAQKHWKAPFDVAVLPPPRLTSSVLGGSVGTREPFGSSAANAEVPIGPSANGVVLNAIGSF